MNPGDEQLDRLFRAAAQAPSTEAPASFGLETRSLAVWREARSGPHGFWDGALLVRGLIVAGVIMAVSFWPALNTTTNPFAEFVQLTDSTISSDTAPMSAQMKPWLVLAVIFLAGVLTGVALTVGFGPRFAQRPGEGQFKKHLTARYVKELNLTPDQQAKLEPILNDTTAKLQALRREQGERASQIFKAADEQLAPLLTPDQKALLTKLESERQKAFPGHGRPRGPGQGSPDGPPPHLAPDDQGVPPPPPPPAEPPPHP